ncbi:MAG: response regulator, partial [Pseudomonadota bacterium]
MTTLADELKPSLPRLRRFARALTGSQQSGDSYVRQTLEAIVHDQSVLDAHLPRDAALYKAFLSVWNSVSANKIATGAPHEEKLAELP